MDVGISRDGHRRVMKFAWEFGESLGWDGIPFQVLGLESCRWVLFANFLGSRFGRQVVELLRT